MLKNAFAGSLTACLVALLVVLMPSLLMAQTIKEHEAKQAEAAERPFRVKNRTQFACAEVASSRNGGSVSHEINLGPNRVERCELIKVGTRLHECKKYKFRNSTVNERGIVSLETEDGPVQFWFDEEARITATEESKVTEGAGKGSLTFIWPDEKHFKYLCAAMH
jgi:hypothetical protein